MPTASPLVAITILPKDLSRVRLYFPIANYHLTFQYGLAPEEGRLLPRHATVPIFLTLDFVWTRKYPLSQSSDHHFLVF